MLNQQPYIHKNKRPSNGRPFHDLLFYFCTGVQLHCLKQRQTALFIHSLHMKRISFLMQFQPYCRVLPDFLAMVDLANPLWYASDSRPAQTNRISIPHIGHY